ncbi:MAG: carbonic anhydrase [Planctomycetes bacterium]|nr:carbonic anhydrase [Planctomycetota bacterium]
MALTSRLALAWALFATAASAVAQRTPDEALRALQDGNRRFVAERSLPQPLGEGVRRTLARGQSPFAIVLCCADSRVPPEHVFNAGLGELFVVRVAGNVCDAETLASIEYAVEHLNVPLCVVLGHEGCGAIGAAVGQAASDGTGAPAGSRALQHLLEQIEPAVRRARARDLGGKALCDAAEEEHVHQTVHECLRRSDLLRRYASVGRFRMAPARYHLDSGEVEWLPVRPLPTAAADETEATVTHGTIPTGVPPHVALRMLQAGHRRFLGDGKPTGDVGKQRREALTHGQQPLAIVLTCADSRVAPEHVFDSGLGELFVIRIAGNTLNDDALASIEYAAAHTGASLLVVMGHTRCGAVQAALEHPENQQLSPNLRALLARIEPSVAAARAQGRGDLVELAVRANVLRTVAEARSRSGLLRQLETDGRFALLPAVYDLATGDLEWLKDQGAAELPAAAPAGESKQAPAHGKHAADDHGKPADHGAHDDHAAAGDLPLLPWATGGNPHGAPHGTAADHGAAAAHGDHGDHGDHAAASSHGSPAHGGADHGHEPAGDDQHGTGTGGDEPWWRDLRHVIGLAGIVSMSLAAVLVMKKRS